MSLPVIFSYLTALVGSAESSSPTLPMPQEAGSFPQSVGRSTLAQPHPTGYLVLQMKD
jgi:hypothetical protein